MASMGDSLGRGPYSPHKPADPDVPVSDILVLPGQVKKASVRSVPIGAKMRETIVPGILDHGDDGVPGCPVVEPGVKVSTSVSQAAPGDRDGIVIFRTPDRRFNVWKGIHGQINRGVPSPIGPTGAEDVLAVPVAVHPDTVAITIVGRDGWS